MIYLIYVYKQDLALNNPQWVIFNRGILTLDRTVN